LSNAEKIFQLFSFVRFKKELQSISSFFERLSNAEKHFIFFRLSELKSNLNRLFYFRAFVECEKTFRYFPFARFKKQLQTHAKIQQIGQLREIQFLKIN